MTPMPSERDKSKRFRPRFSIRTLVILVTLVCCYAACWRPTKNRGWKDVVSGMSQRSIVVTAVAIAPLLVRTDELVVEGTPPSGLKMIVSDRLTRRFHFWFFGYVTELPWEREIPSNT